MHSDLFSVVRAPFLQDRADIDEESGNAQVHQRGSACYRAWRGRQWSFRRKVFGYNQLISPLTFYKIIQQRQIWEFDVFRVDGLNVRQWLPRALYIIKIEIHSSYEVEDFVESHLSLQLGYDQGAPESTLPPFRQYGWHTL